MPEGPLIFLVAGEPSGDQLGARLMAALKAETAGQVRFAGVGGPRMAAEGLDSLFPMDELAVMGLVEVLPHLRGILRRIDDTVAAARAARPDALVTIDSPAFSLRVAKRLKGNGFPLIHYVAPSVWAWKPWRARKIARFLDRLMALLPFEPPYFEAHGLTTTVVGHPAVEAVAEPADGAAFRAAHGIEPQAPVLVVLPGSRRSEVARLAPVFAATLAELAPDFPGLRAVVPTVPTVAPLVEEATRQWPIETTVLNGPAEKYAAFAAADAALAASGTVAVELAVARCPAVVAYRVSPLSAAIARRMLKIRFVSIPNLVLQRVVQPELLQENCTAAKLAPVLAGLLREGGKARERQLADLETVIAALSGTGEGPPSRQAARCVLETIGR